MVDRPSTIESSRRPTVRDVADLAGASLSTTSRVLGGHGAASQKVRAKVLAAAKELGYVPNGQARNLRKRESRSLGVLVSDLRNSFYADFASGVAAAATEAGYTMLLVDDRGSTEAESTAARAFVETRVAGVIATPLSQDVSDYLLSMQVPVVEADRTFAADRCDSIVTNNAVIVRQVVSDLIGLGHRRIGMFVDETQWTTGRDRYTGYQEALREAGIPIHEELVISAGWDAAQAEAVAVETLRSPTPPTAVFAVNNLLAEGVWRAAKILDRRIPAELSLVSFDDSQWMSMVSPGITAIKQDVVDMGRAALELLLARIRTPGSAPTSHVMPASVTVRGSTASPS